MLAGADLATALVVCVTIAAVEGASAGAWALLVAPGWVLLAKLFGLYDRDHRELRHLTIDELAPLTLWAAAATAATMVFLSETFTDPMRFSTALVFAGAAVATACFLRSLARFLWRRITPPERTLIVGDEPLRKLTRRKLALFSDIHVEVMGERELASVAGPGADGNWGRGVNRVIVASSSMSEQPLAALVERCRRDQIKLSVVPPVRGMFGTAVQLNHVADLPVVEYNTWDVSRSTLLLKRTLDLAIGVPLLVLLTPLILLIAAAVRLDGEGPAFFAQRRAGLNGRPFTILKFRTMVPDAEKRLDEVVEIDSLETPMFKLVRDPRVTRIGRLLRRTSLDELPQLINVARGDMSLVGPRPEQVEIVERYRPEHAFRLAVKPGLTGPMQVYGRGLLTFDERLAVERDYVENLSLGRDLRILALTLSVVVAGRGAY